MFETATIVIGFLIFGLIQLGVGILLGRRLASRGAGPNKEEVSRGGKSSLAHQSHRSPSERSLPTSSEHAEMVSRLFRMVSDVRDELGAYREQLELLAGQLAERMDTNPRDLARVFLEAITRSLQINQWLRDRLIEVEERLRRQAEELHRYSNEARTDPLTGLVNRRGFDGALDECLKRSGPRKKPVGLLLMDLDHFKQVNDRLGHPTGDFLLQNLADRLRQLAPTCVVARVGGEEFAILFDGQAPETAEAVARQIHQAVKTPVVTPAGTLTYTISGGIAWAEPGDTPATLYQRADSALYAAKRLGRDCVIALADGRIRLVAPENGWEGAVPREILISALLPSDHREGSIKVGGSQTTLAGASARQQPAFTGEPTPEFGCAASAGSARESSAAPATQFQNSASLDQMEAPVTRQSNYASLKFWQQHGQPSGNPSTKSSLSSSPLAAFSSLPASISSADEAVSSPDEAESPEARLNNAAPRPPLAPNLDAPNVLSQQEVAEIMEEFRQKIRQLIGDDPLEAG